MNISVLHIGYGFWKDAASNTNLLNDLAPKFENTSMLNLSGFESDMGFIVSNNLIPWEQTFTAFKSIQKINFGEINLSYYL